MLEAFLWGLLAAGSLVVGAAIAAVHEPHKRALGLVMAFGAGVLLSAVSFELVEEAVEVAGGTGGVTLGFFAGTLVFLGGDVLISRMGFANRKAVSGTVQSASGLAIVLGIVLDGVPESAVVGLTLLESGTVGVSMVVAVFVSNIPESIAATTSLHNSGWSMARLFALWTATAVLCAFASAAGYAFLDGASNQALAFVFAFAGGAILAMLSTTMMPEAYEHAGRAVGLATTFGFAVAFGINQLAG